MDTKWKSELEDHSRTIIHIDIDCFYAQVEAIKNPKLQFVPLGIRQKDYIVTSNYIARSYGVNKFGPVSEALLKCPNLVLVNGEDLHDYRQKSYEVTSLIQKYSNLVERLGLDENFVDITDLVTERFEQNLITNVVGHTFGETADLCDCGCSLRLKIGTVIAQEIRDEIKTVLKLTTSAGIAHNKLLSKIAGNVHKPDQQTVVFPNNAVELMLSLPSISKIPGIGNTLSEQLGTIDINSVKDLQNTSLSVLSNLLGNEKAKYVKNLSFGIDESVLKCSGKPQSIGIEDSCKVIGVENEVKEKLEQLLSRLVILLAEDGRLPKTIKLTIRRFHKEKKNRSTRETRQCNINPSLFNFENKTQLSEGSMKKIMTIIMHLFHKIVDAKKTYHLTLLGLAFTKFLEKPSVTNVLTNFIKKDIEVQSVTDIKNNIATIKSTDLVPTTLDVFQDSDSEPPVKKYKVTNRHLDSPTDLPVANLNLSSEPVSLNNMNQVFDDSISGTSERNIEQVECPPNIDQSVFRELPTDVQHELWDEYKQDRQTDRRFEKNKRLKSNNILNYFSKK
ncbi:DNA polymerase iota [Diorhabda sublineata]|uniref:DNA polymerase iota n=1 Tax=Diorhabda sublineata TaxID=1163346 RepID=UPI0024E1425F|nr:DNA polymerase iota [Diorhabda sublineata]